MVTTKKRAGNRLRLRFLQMLIQRGRMNISWRVFAVLVLSAILAVPVTVKAGPATDAGEPSNPATEKADVFKALDNMGAYLRTLDRFEVKSTTTLDDVLDSGQKVQFGGTVHLQVRRPDRLRAEINGNQKDCEFFYDGKNFTLVGRKVNFYATVPAPPTLRELVTELGERYGIETPLVDLFLWGSDDNRRSDVQSAVDIGSATIDGTECEQYALRQPGIDWQVWIQKGRTPLPRKLVITTISEPSQPQYAAVMDWNTTPKLDNAVFNFTPQEGAQRIAMQTSDGKVAKQTR